jgi:hypothetical protein
MVRREQRERIKNRLEKFKAVPKREVGEADGLRNPCVFSGGKSVTRTPRIFKKR